MKTECFAYTDQMCVSDFHWGAMENWGLVIYREVYLLYDPIISSIEERYLTTSVIAHELSHQVSLNIIFNRPNVRE